MRTGSPRSATWSEREHDRLREFPLHPSSPTDAVAWLTTDRARADFERYGFRSLADDDVHPFLPFETICKLIAS
jgi:hypothetical protein